MMPPVVSKVGNLDVNPMQQPKGQDQKHDKIRSATSFHNKSGVQNQAAYQTNYGHIFHGPVHIIHDAEAGNLLRTRQEADHLQLPDTACEDIDEVSEVHSNSEPRSDRNTSLSTTDQVKILRSLRFDQIDTRHATIRPAHVKTCKWLLERKEYRNWLAPDPTGEHHGFLWIKGKPATGKSTIMKYTLNNMKSQESEAKVVSFFFSARGAELEKTLEGMYRSLLSQLFEMLPDLQKTLYSHHISRDTSGGIVWGLESLKVLFNNTIKALHRRPVIIFVDALDECDEDQVQDMVSFFEELCVTAAESDFEHGLRICFSSRHYPYITIQKSISLVLEDQPEHDVDIQNYLSSELKIGSSETATEIRTEILRRASGIFLWVVLVVQMINKEYRHGRLHALQQRLEEIPDGLDDLFDEILTRDGQPNPEVVLCLQWVLFATDPLTAQELYVGILLGTEPDFMPVWDARRITPDDVARFILSSSKGLVEETKGSRPIVQVIHESVRDFFLRTRQAKKQYLGPVETLAARSHDKLKRLCHTYFKRPQIHKFIRSKASSLFDASMDPIYMRGKLCEMFPLLRYAIQYVLRHGDLAEYWGCGQNDFVSKFPVRLWAGLYNILGINKGRHYSSKVTLSYVLAMEGRPYLLELELARVGIIPVQGEQYESLLQAAAITGSYEAITRILQYEYLKEDHRATSQSEMERFSRHVEQSARWLMKYAIHFSFSSPISLAMLQRQYRVLNCLVLSRSMPLDPASPEARQALQVLSSSGYSKGAQILRDVGVSSDEPVANTDTDRSTTVGSAASSSPLPSRPKAHPVSKDEGGSRGSMGLYSRRMTLCRAAELGDVSLVRELIAAGADINAVEGIYRGALQAASAKGHREVVLTLLRAGADMYADGGDFGRNASEVASYHGQHHIVGVLNKVRRAAYIAARDDY